MVKPFDWDLEDATSPPWTEARPAAGLYEAFPARIMLRKETR
jgi:hypothetical protein